MSNMTVRLDGDATHCIDSVHLRRKVMGRLPSPLLDRSSNGGDRQRTPYDLAVGTGERADRAGARLTPTYALYEWTKAMLPELNADVLARRSSVNDFLVAVQGALPVLENPTRCDLDECRRQMVVLGMIGSSLERHNQEDGRRPGEAVAALQVGRWPFRRYIATLASRVGGPPRDSFQSFVMWNGSLVDIYLPGDTEPILQFPNVFQSSPLTFSDDPAELLFLSLLKRCAALEAAANLLLWPLCEGLFELDEPAALTRVEDATVLMQGIRSEMNGFRHSKDFTATFFLDVLRQYACAWDSEGSYSAPSGAHDVEYVVRDLLLGTPVSHLDDHIDDLFHVLAPSAQTTIQRARSVSSFTVRLGHRLGVDLERQLPTMTQRELTVVVESNPWLAAYHALYKASAEISASHWAMVYSYLVSPMKQRELDAVVVSNHAGTGGLTMEVIRQFMSDRAKHVLSPLLPVLRRPASASQP
jgi:hypothetical protein